MGLVGGDSVSTAYPLGIALVSFGFIFGQIWSECLADVSTSWSNCYTNPGTSWINFFSDPTTTWDDC